MQGLSYNKMVDGIKTIIGKQMVRDGTYTATGAKANAIRIIRTESHRTMSSGHYAASKYLDSVGLDVKRKMLAVLDNRTRSQSATMDGQTVGIDEPFIYPNGSTSFYPGNSGTAKYDINDRERVIDIFNDTDPKLQSQETKDILQRGAMLQSDPANNFRDAMSIFPDYYGIGPVQLGGNNNAATPPSPTAKEEEPEYMQMVRDQIQRDLDEVEPRYKQGLKGARNLLFQNLTGNAMGTLAGMVGVLSQDAFSEAPKVARVNTPRTMGKGYYDYLNWNNNKALRSAVSAALENTDEERVSFSEALLMGFIYGDGNFAVAKGTRLFV